MSEPKLETKTLRWVNVGEVRVEPRPDGRVALIDRQPVPVPNQIFGQQQAMSIGQLSQTRTVTVEVEAEGLRAALDLLEES